MPDQPPVTLIIPNYNGARLLEGNLPSVLAALAEYPGGAHLIVVDDGSTDDSLDVLTQGFPQVTVVRHADNQGFAEAVHSGVRAATTEDLIFLNSDVRPEAGFIAPLLRRLGADDGVFSVQSAIREEAGNIHPYCLARFRFRAGALKRLSTPRLGDRPWHCLYASGGSMAVTRTKFLALGGFLPIFKPFYWEDFDLGVRAWRRGWRSCLEPASVVLHQERGAIRDNVKRQRVRRALLGNRLLAELIHFPAGTLAVFFLPRTLLRGLARTLAGDLGYWRAVFDAALKAPEALAVRRTVQATAVQDFRQVLRLIEQENAGHPEAAP